MKRLGQNWVADRGTAILAVGHAGILPPRDNDRRLEACLPHRRDACATRL